ncbi:lipopolysaccharide biosynthesis protein [Actinomycetospora sp. CA-053990]|uniref:lipopolysaccharide biosynthesis protein n=1 Tax=Actinomycetospora sp. CA-053990 TaxID=3239891 RepID=UPI003D945E62
MLRGAKLGPAATLTATRLAATAVQAGTLVLIARVAGPVEFATFAALFGALQVLQAVIDGGATGYTLANHWRGEAVTQAFRISSLFGLAVSTLVVLAISFVAFQDNSAVLWALAPLGIWLAIERACETRATLLIARGRFRPVAASLLLRRAGVGCTMLISISVPQLWAWLFSLSSIAFGAASFLVIASSIPFQKVALSGVVRDRARAMRPFWSASVSQQIRQLDVTILAFINPAAAISFAPASRLGTPLRLLPVAYSQILLSTMARDRRGVRRNELASCLVFAVCVYAPLAATAWIWVPFLLGSDYESSSAPIAIFILGLIPFSVASVLNSSTQATGRAAYAAMSGWAGGISTLAFVFTLGVNFGATGAAIANCLGAVVQGLILAIREKRRQISGENDDIGSQGRDTESEVDHL